jgi:hypothetical protein
VLGKLRALLSYAPSLLNFYPETGAYQVAEAGLKLCDPHV